MTSTASIPAAGDEPGSASWITDNPGQQAQHPPRTCNRYVDGITTFASPLDFEKTKVEFRRHAPRIGEDGVEVLREAGLSDSTIDRLKAEKALIVPA